MTQTDVFENSYAEQGERSTGKVLDKLSWIEGCVRTLIALPILISGYTKYDRWNSWEKEHNKKESTVEFYGSRLVLNF